MPKRIARVLLPALFALLAAVPAAAQSLRAVVTDARTGAPVAEAMVRVLAPDGSLVRSAFTDAGGAAVLRLRGAGTYRVAVDRSGYRPTSVEGVAVAPGAPLVVPVRMETAPLVIDTVTVIAASRDERGRDAFERRRSMGIGVFLDSAYIAARYQGARWPTDYLRDIPGIQVDRSGPRGEPRPRSLRGWRCMVLMMDGRPLELTLFDGHRRTIQQV
ncbi:MAG TPA: carboxypeptidase-like regulatory domain-containing protein, partial [Longimicrobium sp.]